MAWGGLFFREKIGVDALDLVNILHRYADIVIDHVLTEQVSIDQGHLDVILWTELPGLLTELSRSNKDALRSSLSGECSDKLLDPIVWPARKYCPSPAYPL